MFSEENKIPEQCLKLERWQGPPHINTMKQYKLCFPLRSVCLFSDEDEQFDYFVLAEKDSHFLSQTTDCSFNPLPSVTARVTLLEMLS